MKKEPFTYLGYTSLCQEAEGYFHEAIRKMPFMDMDTYNALTISIIYLGLLEPIVLYQDKIIDGRARYLACLETNTQPRFEEWKGDDTSLFFYVWSKNALRAHLTEGQMAMSHVYCKEGLDRYFAQFDAD